MIMPVRNSHRAPASRAQRPLMIFSTIGPVSLIYGADDDILERAPRRILPPSVTRHTPGKQRYKSPACADIHDDTTILHLACHFDFLVPGISLFQVLISYHQQ